MLVTEPEHSSRDAGEKDDRLHVLTRLAAAIHYLAVEAFEGQEEKEFEEQWAFVSGVFDRLYFIIFFVSNVIILLAVLVIYPLAYGQLAYPPPMFLNLAC